MTRALRKASILVAIAASLNYLLVGGFLGFLAFNIVRALLSIWAGWFFVSSAGAGLVGAACAGTLVMVIDHVLLKGGFFVLAHFFWPQAVGGEGLLAFQGVLFSFIMFAPLAALLGVVGGLFERWRAKRAASNPSP